MLSHQTEYEAIDVTEYAHSSNSLLYVDFVVGPFNKNSYE